MDDLKQDVDLEAARDEKVLPVAKAAMGDIAELMMPADPAQGADYRPLLAALLKRALDADFNLTTENPYLFQALLSAFKGLNAAIQGCQTEPIDEARMSLIGKKILAIVAASNITYGDVDDETQKAEFLPVQEQLNALFYAEHLSLIEVKYIMDNVFEAFSAVQTGFMAGIEQSSDRAAAKLYGIDVMSDLTMQKLDTVLKAPMLVAASDADIAASTADADVVAEAPAADKVAPTE